MVQKEGLDVESDNGLSSFLCFMIINEEKQSSLVVLLSFLLN